jgi:5-methylcytosine-specific restriction endonuclease McrA
VKRSEGASIEVNHIVPLVGRGYHYGCVHHQSNLETLCKMHHRERTNQQLADRKKQVEKDSEV